MNKIYLAFMGSSNSLEDIQELVEPVKQYFNGVCALLHDCDENSSEANYLLKVNNELGGGNIIFGAYIGRHDHSRNRILYETGIKEGDFIIQIDLLERVAVDFAAHTLPLLINWMTNKNIDICYYFAKPYVIKFREDMRYQGNPHESLIGDRPMNLVELNREFKDESKVRINVRPIKRTDPYHWVGHYLKYLLLPNSNQNLLGLEHHGGFSKLNGLNKIRFDFLLLLDKRGYERTANGVIALFRNSFDDEVKYFVNNHKILNDAYRYFILGDKSVKDNHLWDHLEKF